MTALRLTCLLALTGCLSTSSAAGPRVMFVPPASGVNVSSTHIHTARSMLVQRLGSGLRVINLDRPPSYAPMPLAAARDVARAFQATEVLLLDLSHANGATTLTLGRYDVATGRVLAIVRQQTAAGPEVMTDLVEAALIELTGGPAARPRARWQ